MRDFWRLGTCSLSHHPKPFSEKSDREKDELFEKIAEQLAAIADHYSLDSPCNSKKCLMSDVEQETSAKTVDAPVSMDPSGGSLLVIKTSDAEPSNGVWWHRGTHREKSICLLLSGESGRVFDCIFNGVLHSCFVYREGLFKTMVV